MDFDLVDIINKMSHEIDKRIHLQNQSRKFVSQHSGGPGGVGFGQPDADPISGTDVEGPEVNLFTKEKRTKRAKGHAIILTTPTGKIVSIPGKIGRALSAKDIKEVLDSNQAKELDDALFENLKKIGTPSHVVGR